MALTKGSPAARGDRAKCAPLALSNSLADLAARINVEHEATVAVLKRGAVEHAMAASDLLIEAKAAQVPHGSWRGWIAANCKLSERSVQLYMRLAKHREVTEKGWAKSAMGVADLTLNEAAALCVLAGRIKKLMDFAKRAEGASPEQLVNLCAAEGCTLIKDQGSYYPFLGRSEAEIREWLLFGSFIGRGSTDACHAQVHDRAGVVATTVLAIVTDALRQWPRGGSAAALTDVHTQVETVVRDEFADLAHQVRGERDVLD